MSSPPASYRGRIAPSPTGRLHLGHARTFWTAFVRARDAGGDLVLRNEDLDPQRAKPEFVAAFIEDLRWLGVEWSEGPDVGGPYGPYAQSERSRLYDHALTGLIEVGLAYPCTCSRRDIQRAVGAPHQGEDELMYPGTCRPGAGEKPPVPEGRHCWRFRVPEGEAVEFIDANLGPQSFVGGKDFGDFVLRRPDGVPSYQLAVVVDDAAMRITEVVRGADLLVSTARQLLLYRALGFDAPAFFHCPLMLDDHGERLAKRHDALSVRALRESGKTPADVRAMINR